MDWKSLLFIKATNWIQIQSVIVQGFLPIGAHKMATSAMHTLQIHVKCTCHIYIAGEARKLFYFLWHREVCTIKARRLPNTILWWNAAHQGLVNAVCMLLSYICGLKENFPFLFYLCSIFLLFHEFKPNSRTDKVLHILGLKSHMHMSKMV